MLLALALLACGSQTAPPSEAQAYARALDPARPLAEAMALCEGLSGEDARGDCATAALEARGRLEPEDCAAVPAGRWREECWFLLAERMAAAGQLAEAVALCQQTRFSRECSFHLLRTQAQEAPSAADAEARLAVFQGAWPVPDAEQLYWQEWFRARQAEGQPVDMAVCAALERGEACAGAVKRLWEAASRALTPQRLCEALAEGRAPLTLRGGAPAFVLDAGLIEAASGRCEGYSSGG
ncbi:MAG: hypothetical protein H6741_23545 [Alphaproteobacteria bacterium]|nr:hypothetical protein [Alphaproteobacteria bacterium]MCB9795682.1 hypothetical protein [Alphaproteobacteria bacterium]